MAECFGWFIDFVICSGSRIECKGAIELVEPVFQCRSELFVGFLSTPEPAFVVHNRNTKRTAPLRFGLYGACRGYRYRRFEGKYCFYGVLRSRHLTINVECYFLWKFHYTKNPSIDPESVSGDFVGYRLSADCTWFRFGHPLPKPETGRHENT